MRYLAKVECWVPVEAQNKKHAAAVAEAELRFIVDAYVSTDSQTVVGPANELHFRAVGSPVSLAEIWRGERKRPYESD